MIKYLEINYKNKILRGTVHIPENKNQKFPAVIMFHGFGANRIEYYYSFVKMSNILMKNNIASIRFDFLGHGESDGEFEDVTLSSEVNESMAIIDYTKKLDFIDENNINLLGMSFGGVVASIVAGERKNDINKLCMWAPAAAVLDEINIHKRLQGKSLDEIEEKGYLDFHGLKVSQKLVEDINKSTIYQRACKFEKDVKIIHGDKDIIAPLKYSEKYREFYKQDIEIHIMKGADHSFGTVQQRQELYSQTLEFYLK